MFSVERLDARLDAASDRLSPLVIKEVRQFVRSREFLISFVLSLVIALVIAAYGSAQAIGGSTTAGRSTFATLLACLVLLGCAAVPIGAFGALRTERLEQTLDLIALTGLSPRRIVIGKLLAQGAKLATFFAVMAPFMATSFLLGGVDFLTIGVAVGAVFLWSMWIAAAAICASSMVTSRVASGLVLGVFGIVLLFFVTIGRALFLSPYAATRMFGLSGLATRDAIAPALFGLITMANLILLAETRLAPPSQSRAAPLRIGLFIQFLFIVGWAFIPWAGTGGGPTGTSASAYSILQQVEWLSGMGGLHLAAIALFLVTQGSEAVPRPGGEVRRGAATRTRDWWWLFGAGAAPTALYVLIQMAIFIATPYLLGGLWEHVRMFVVICGAICLFSGLPSYFVHHSGWWTAPRLAAQGLILVLVFLSLILPDLVHFVVWRPETFEAEFSRRHLFSPVLTLMNWPGVELSGWTAIPMAWSVLGFASYLVLLRRDRVPAPAPAPAATVPAPDNQPV